MVPGPKGMNWRMNFRTESFRLQAMPFANPVNP